MCPVPQPLPAQELDGIGRVPPPSLLPSGPRLEEPAHATDLARRDCARPTLRSARAGSRRKDFGVLVQESTALHTHGHEHGHSWGCFPENMVMSEGKRGFPGLGSDRKRALGRLVCVGVGGGSGRRAGTLVTHGRRWLIGLLDFAVVIFLGSGLMGGGPDCGGLPPP